jgi:hypothetical protein
MMLRPGGHLKRIEDGKAGIAEATDEFERPNAVSIDDRVQIDVATMLVLSQKGPYPLECSSGKVEG